MSKTTKKTTINKEPEIVESEVVKTEVPSTNIKKETQSPEENNKGLKIGLGICLGCLIIIILIFVGAVATGGFLFKKLALPFAKKVSNEVRTEIKQQNNPSSETPNPTITESEGLPSNFPKDFPIYPNAKSIKGAESQILNKTGYFVTMESSDTVPVIDAFYKNKLALVNWIIEKEFGDEKSNFFTIKKGKQTGLITISLKENSSLTTINIVLGGE